MSYQIRDVDLESVPFIHAMNEGSLPHVNSVTEDYFRSQVDGDSYFRAVFINGRSLAFALAMDETADYGSLNFLWFKARYERFVYIDRVVVSMARRRAGLGASLYDDVARWARCRAPMLGCEVNLKPPNEPSMRFHEDQGFVQVGTQETENGRKLVSLMVKRFDLKAGM